MDVTRDKPGQTDPPGTTDAEDWYAVLRMAGYFKADFSKVWVRGKWQYLFLLEHLYLYINLHTHFSLTKKLPINIKQNSRLLLPVRRNILSPISPNLKPWVADILNKQKTPTGGKNTATWLRTSGYSGELPGFSFCLTEPGLGSSKIWKRQQAQTQKKGGRRLRIAYSLQSKDKERGSPAREKTFRLL